MSEPTPFLCGMAAVVSLAPESSWPASFRHYFGKNMQQGGLDYLGVMARFANFIFMVLICLFIEWIEK